MPLAPRAEYTPLRDGQPEVTTPRACSRSASRGRRRPRSRPARRTSPGVITPAASPLPSLGTSLAWVIEAGCSMSVSTPPSDTARVVSLTASITVAAGLEAAFQPESEGRAGAAHLPLREVVLGVRWQTRVTDPCDLGRRLEPAGDSGVLPGPAPSAARASRIRVAPASLVRVHVVPTIVAVAELRRGASGLSPRRSRPRRRRDR